jgi:hypothetical protein
MTDPVADPVRPAFVWKRVVASILDFFTVFLVAGYLIGAATGDITPGGTFNLNGWPALLLFAIIIAYFFFGRRYAGGTLWDRIFRIGRPQPYK